MLAGTVATVALAFASNAQLLGIASHSASSRLSASFTASNNDVRSGSPASPNGASGAVVALSQDGLTFACKDILDPLLEKSLNDLTLPDIDTKKGGVSIKINNMRTQDFKCTDCAKVALVSGSNPGIQLDVADFEIGLHSRYVLKDIISTGGECDSKLTGVDVHGVIKIGLSGDGHPTLTIDDVAASVGKIDLGCSGVSGSLLDALADVFKDKVESAISDAVKKAIPPEIDQISKQLGAVPLDIPITNNFAEVRFDLSSVPTVNATYITVPTLGTVAPTSSPGQVAPYTIPSLPPYDDSQSSFVQVILSDYVFNSAAYTYWKAGRLSTVISPSFLPPSFPLQLNTSSLAAIAPGLAQKYPTAVPVQVVAAADPLTKPLVAVHATGLNVTLPSLLSFQPIPQGSAPVDGFTLSCPLTAAATLSFSGTNVAGDVNGANCTLLEFNSTVGSVNVPAANALADYIITQAVIPEINKVANAGIPIPAVDGYKLTNARLKLYETYAVVAADIAPK